MKKIITFIIFIFISLNYSFACEVTNDLWKKIPENFKVNCYKKIWELNPKINSFNSSNWEKCLGWNTLKINSTEKIDTFISNGEIIPNKLYKNSWNSIDYKINLEWNINYLKDNNYKTSLILDTIKNNKIEIEFNEQIKTNNFNFQYITDNFYPEYKISNDWEIFKLVSKNNLKDYSFKYLKIFFKSKSKEVKNEKIKIEELNFITSNYTYLIKSLWNITAYSDNICNNNFIDLSNNISDFNLDNNTTELDLKLINNSDLNLFKKNDLDNDWIDDSIDNCKSIYNPMQKDKNWNWVWDLCSDDDNDGIIWKKDNCIYIYNPNQKDINTNWVWDKCEFDKDTDWIFDEIDNCINIANPNQKDTDNDWIWDVCDNSIYYNPSQIDKNNNWIWDITEEKEKHLKENDKDTDWIIDYKDNCKDIANSDQKDTDNDW